MTRRAQTVTARDNQAATAQPHEPTDPHDGAPTNTDTDPDSQPPTHYIRHIVDTAPRPNPTQLARLAGLLRTTDDNPNGPS